MTHLPSSTARPEINVIYIAGAERSGSTLLNDLLGQVPGITSLGEIKYIWRRSGLQNYLCGCGLPFTACEFWQQVFQVVLGNHDQEQVGQIAERAHLLDQPHNLPHLLGDRRSPHLSEHLSQHLDILEILYRAIAQVAHTRWIVDSSKDASYAALLANIPGINLHLIHLVRDSRAVAFSWTRLKERPDFGPDFYMSQLTPQQAALAWIHKNLAVQSLSAIPQTYLRVRYEDLVWHLQEHIQVILDKVEFEGQISLEVFTSDAVNLAPRHSVAGNPIRLENGERHIQLDDQWQHAMRPDHYSTVTATTLPLLTDYGYMPSTGL